MAKKTESEVNELNPFGFTEVEVNISDIKKHQANPRKITKRDQAELQTSLEKFGLLDKPILNKDYTCIAGHQRIEILEKKGVQKVKVLMPEVALTEAQVLELLIRHNKNTGEWDFVKLAAFDTATLVDYGWDANSLGKLIVDQTEEDKVEELEPEYPLAPRMSEKHSYVMIMVENEIEKAHLETLLDLETTKDYKSSKIGIGRVITFDKFKSAIDQHVKEKTAAV